MELSSHLSSAGNYRAPSQDGWVPCTPLGCIKDSAVAYAQGCKRKREDRRLTCWGPLGTRPVQKSKSSGSQPPVSRRRIRTGDSRPSAGGVDLQKHASQVLIDTR